MSSPAFAIKIIRTGGDALDCEQYNESYDPKTKSTTVWRAPNKVLALDIETNRQFRQMDPVTENLTGSAVERAAQLIGRLEKLDPVRSAKFRGWLSTWDKDARIEDKVFDDIPDSENFAQAFDCKPLQLIIQENDQGLITYRISRPVWERMDVNHQAFMIMHELVYRDAYALRHDNSFFVAYLNSLIASDRLRELTPEQYKNLLKDLGL